MIDFTGKYVLVTGGGVGIGRGIAEAFAKAGAHVFIAEIDPERAADVAAAIPSADVIVCDVLDRSVPAMLAERIGAKAGRLDVLVNNAGVMAPALGRTADGFETQIGTNHLGHFALTGELFTLIERGHLKRIVTLSSRGHHFAPVDLDDPHYERRAYDPWQSYGQSKTANILFTVGLEARFAVIGIHAYAVHPGGIHTNLGRHMTPAMVEALMARVTSSDSGFQWKTIPQGAATSCWAATAPELEGGSGTGGGVYCEDCHVAEVDDEAADKGVRSYALNSSYADQLWALSEAATGVRYPG